MAIDKERFRKTVTDTSAQRSETRRLVHANRWREAEPDRDRAARFSARTAAMTLPRGAEAMIGDTNDLQVAWFLPAGAKARLAVAYVEANNARTWEAGSGFMVPPALFL